MSDPTALLVLGPSDGRLEVRTYRDGPAQKAGHDLVLEVGRWEATVARDRQGRPQAVRLTADPDSLEVREGHGGLKPLGEPDRREIARNIEGKVLRGRPIAFASERVVAAAGGLRVTGSLTIGGISRPVSVALETAAGRVRGSMLLRQSDWGIKPYSALLGALRVRDEIEIEIQAVLPGA